MRIIDETNIPSFQPVCFAATTCADPASSTPPIGIYFAEDGGIQELKMAADQTWWTRSPLIVFPEAAVAIGSPVASASAKDLIYVFFCDTTETLRDMVFDAQSGSWSLGSLKEKLVSPNPQLQAIVWAEQDGSLSRSVFFTGAEGYIYEASKRDNSDWEIHLAVPAHGQHPFWASLSTDNGVVTKHLFYRSGPRQLDEATSKRDGPVPTSRSSPWSTHQLQVYAPADDSEEVGMAGTILSSAGSEVGAKLLLSPSSTLEIRDYTAPTSLTQPWKEGEGVPFAKAKPASSMHVVAIRAKKDKEEHVHLFYLDDDGKLVTTNWTKTSGWRTFITVVAVLVK
ncbi:hypothetical protein FRB96_005871 [Tulasnella sp. 330]|nr:hypothetical protein FRB96_005871 [Tulasnella sp. 330]